MKSNNFKNALPSTESSKLAANQHAMMAKFLFYVSLGIVFYSYVGYGILLYFLVLLKRFFQPQAKGLPLRGFEPEVTLVVAAYNEAEFIEEKIRNSLDLDYPPGKLHWIFITDGSTDETPSVISTRRAPAASNRPAASRAEASSVTATPVNCAASDSFGVR